MKTGALAKALKISPQRVNELARKGKLTRPESGEWDLAQVRRELESNLDARQARKSEQAAAEETLSPAGGPPVGTLLYEQWRLTREKADREALDRKVLEGLLLKRSEAKDAVSAMIVSSKAKLLVIGDELADKLAATSDPVRCREMVDERVGQALAALAEYPADAA